MSRSHSEAITVDGDVSAKLIEGLSNSACYEHPIGRIEKLQTHISWILLTGEYAYKIKKPVNLGFADFSTLEKRRFYCEEELRLNRRLAPQTYLSVVPIVGTPDCPKVNGTGEPIEYAVKMRQFSDDARLDRVLTRGELLPHHLDKLSQTLVRFHSQAAIADEASPFGKAGQAFQPMEDTFDELLRLVEDPQLRSRLEVLRVWATASSQTIHPILNSRKLNAHIRECHGDLHLENMVLLDDEVVPFDCLEFNERLRWIDVMSDLAFTVMDLIHRGRPDLGWRFLNGYLEISGDYEGIPVLRLYMVYRALVRAKVACIRIAQVETDLAQRNRFQATCKTFIELAQKLAAPPKPMMIITHGISGTGKTTVTQRLLEILGAIRVRSDVVRKRSIGIRKNEIYSPLAKQQTYQRLLELVEMILTSGYSAIVDATFLEDSRRQEFLHAAETLHVPLVILDFQAPVELLRARINERLRKGTDASDADLQILEQQLAIREPLTECQRRLAITIDAERLSSVESLAQEVRTLAEKQSF